MSVARGKLLGFGGRIFGSGRIDRSSPISTKDCPFGQSFHCRTADDYDRELIYRARISAQGEIQLTDADDRGERQ